MEETPAWRDQPCIYSPPVSLFSFFFFFFLRTNGALNTLVCVFTCGLEAARVLISIPKKSLTFRKRGHKYSLACGQNSSTRIGGGGRPKISFPLLSDNC